LPPPFLLERLAALPAFFALCLRLDFLPPDFFFPRVPPAFDLRRADEADDFDFFLPPFFVPLGLLRFFDFYAVFFAAALAAFFSGFGAFFAIALTAFFTGAGAVF